jgi:hypothetical protein
VLTGVQKNGLSDTLKCCQVREREGGGGGETGGIQSVREGLCKMEDG